MRQQLPQIVILSAELSENTKDQNEHLTAKLACALGDMNMPFKSVQGMYKGHKENSFLVIVRDFKEISLMNNLAWAYHQESILYCDQDRNAFLVYCDGTPADALGVFQKVDSVEGLDAYTIDGDEYWTCKGEQS